MKRKAKDDDSNSDIDDPTDNDDNKKVEYFPNLATRFANPFYDKDDTLWMIGWDQLIRDERCKACLGVVQSRLDENCYNILQVDTN